MPDLDSSAAGWIDGVVVVSGGGGAGRARPGSATLEIYACTSFDLNKALQGNGASRASELEAD